MLASSSFVVRISFGRFSNGHESAGPGWNTSTAVFALSALPMLLKAFNTKDLGSSSVGSILLANVGNDIHSTYVLSLLIGRIWLPLLSTW
jgi:hypothetical protein